MCPTPSIHVARFYATAHGSSLTECAYSSGFATVPLDEALAAMQQEIAINDIDQQQPDASRGRWSQSRRDLILAPFDPNLA